MNRFQKGLVGLGLAGLLTVSGCGLINTNNKSGDYVNADLSESRYKDLIKNTADEKAKSENIHDLRDAIEGYKCIGELSEMDRILEICIKKNLRTTLHDLENAEKAHKYFEKKRK